MRNTRTEAIANFLISLFSAVSPSKAIFRGLIFDDTQTMCRHRRKFSRKARLLGMLNDYVQTSLSSVLKVAIAPFFIAALRPAGVIYAFGDSFILILHRIDISGRHVRVRGFFSLPIADR